MNLLLAPKNENLKIIRIKESKNGKKVQMKHLKNLGFVTGAEISVVSEVNGNLIVKVKDSKVALGEEIAKSIYVQ